MASLQGWATIKGLQFENLVLNNISSLAPLVGLVGKNGKADWGNDEDFFGDSQYDADELDSEGFQDLRFEDGTMF